MAMTFSFKAFFDGIGRTYVHMVSSIVMNVVNVVLCIAFIFGYWGAPRMGVAGAGFAAFVSTWIGLQDHDRLGVLGALPHHVPAVRARAAVAQGDGDVLRLSIPSAIATVAVMSGFALFAMIVSRLDALTHAEIRWSAPAVAPRPSTAPPRC